MTDEQDMSEIIPSVSDLIGYEIPPFQQRLRDALTEITELLVANADKLKAGDKVQWISEPGVRQVLVDEIIEQLESKHYIVEPAYVRTINKAMLVISIPRNLREE